MIHLTTRGILGDGLSLVTKGILFGIVLVVEEKAKLMKEGWMKVGRWRLIRGY